jgi:hypothetical protein
MQVSYQDTGRLLDLGLYQRQHGGSHHDEKHQHNSPKGLDQALFDESVAPT